MQYDEPTLISEVVKSLKRAGGVLLLVLLLAACSVDVSDIKPPTEASGATARPPTATLAPHLTPRADMSFTPPPPSPTSSSQTGLHLTGHLIFIQVNGQLVKLDLASSQTMTLFQAPPNAWPAAASVSPNGQQIVMAYAPPPKDPSQQFGYTDLYILPADGSGVPRVLLQRTDPQEAYAFPQWSADGRFIYYAHEVPDTTGRLRYIHFTYTIERVAYPNGRPQKILDDAIWPRLSPDGKKLTYVSFNQQTGENNLYVADVDGRHARPAVAAGTFYAVDAPLFFPDGRTILFSAVGGPAASQLPGSVQWVSSHRPNLMMHNVPSDWWRVDLASGKIEPVTRIADTGMYADFAPDGQYIAFVAATGLYLMNPEGGNLTRLLNFGPEGSVEWIP